MIAENQTFWSLYLNFIKKELNQLRFQLDSHISNFLSVSELKKNRYRKEIWINKKMTVAKELFKALTLNFKKRFIC